MVVAEGELQHSGVFKATALGLPPVESRRTSEIAAKVLSLFSPHSFRVVAGSSLGLCRAALSVLVL